MRRCPTCSTLVEKVWESIGGINGGSWWTGNFSCPHCGLFHASGTERDGIRTIVQWSPGCPTHGTEPVHLVDLDNRGNDYEWCCSVCHRRLKNQGGKIVVTWKPYEPVFLTTEMVDKAIEQLESANA